MELLRSFSRVVVTIVYALILLTQVVLFTAPAGQAFQLNKLDQPQVESDYLTDQVAVSLSSAKVLTDDLYTIYLPVIAKSNLELYGMVRLNGVPVSDTVVTLRKCGYAFSPGSDCLDIQDKTTDINGVYNFTNVLPLTITEKKTYRVEFRNPGDSRYLAQWATASITTYDTSALVHIGSFDIADVPLLAPSAGITVSLTEPLTFQWAQRNSSFEDLYGIEIIYAPRVVYHSPLLDADTYIFTPTTTSGWIPGDAYLWHVIVKNPDGGTGASFELRSIVFSP